MAMGHARTRAYRDGVLVDEDFAVDDVSERLAADDRTIIWVDFVRPGPDDLAPLAGELGLHALAIEDALEPHQRSKLDRYPSHLFLSCHAVRLGADDRRLHKSEIDAFVGTRWLVTVRADDEFAIDDVLKRWDGDPELTAQGVGVLVHALLDEVVDGYFTVAEAIDDYYEDAGDRVFSEHPLRPDQQRGWFEMRRTLSQFRRLVLPLREALSGLLRHESALVNPEVLPYWQDLYDHVVVVSETTDGLRDLAASLVDANLALRDYRQNQVMKTVSSWAAIVAAPTLVTGYYGMNVPFPGSGETAGVIWSAVVIVAISVGLYVLFRRRGWL
jgi:magnesium transporter